MQTRPSPIDCDYCLLSLPLPLFLPSKYIFIHVHPAASLPIGTRAADLPLRTLTALTRSSHIVRGGVRPSKDPALWNQLPCCALALASFQVLRCAQCLFRYPRIIFQLGRRSQSESAAGTGVLAMPLYARGDLLRRGCSPARLPKYESEPDESEGSDSGRDVARLQFDMCGRSSSSVVELVERVGLATFSSTSGA
ncbi:uncharacterized protein VDAG_08316 [Verticillium dahliae VdLs.17]|uniref:Uncharacterized protein n=1 Tax=Verticillium dahliae (strain VdLs.17 / ATCC MYA-4575 / FGSC 10137) TaxID=498257 RepID=G2XDT4_VERDV|nr:uncharacterized protein VDAG_08316 [Verticillium dahliae VdLs.17]EGY17982.1 hypothetical protein VDAG_08316 [Verticillium dahliae VdLs.17]